MELYLSLGLIVWVLASFIRFNSFFNERVKFPNLVLGFILTIFLWPIMVVNLVKNKSDNNDSLVNKKQGYLIIRVTLPQEKKE